MIRRLLGHPRPPDDAHVRPGHVHGRRAARHGQHHLALRAEGVRRRSAAADSVGPRGLPAGRGRRRSLASRPHREDAGRDEGRDRWRFCARAFPKAARSRRRSTASRSRRRGSVCWPPRIPAILPPELASRWRATGRPARKAAQCCRWSAPSTRWGRRSSRCRARRTSRCRCTSGAAAVPLQHAAQSVVRLDRDELEPLADGPDGIGQLHPVHRRDPADALRLGHPDEVRPGGDGLRAGRVLGVGNEDAGHIQMAEYAPEVVYVAQDRSRQPDLRLGHSRIARPRRERSTSSCIAAPSRRRRSPKKVFTGQPEHSARCR